MVSDVAMVLDIKVLPQEPASSHFGIPFRQDPVFEDLLLEFHRIGLTILRHYHPGNPPPAENILNQLNFDMDHCSAHLPFGRRRFFSHSCPLAGPVDGGIGPRQYPVSFAMTRSPFLLLQSVEPLSAITKRQPSATSTDRGCSPRIHS